MDSGAPKVPMLQYVRNETRYRMLIQADEHRAEMLMQSAREDVEKRWNLYKQMAAIQYKANGND